MISETAKKHIPRWGADVPCPECDIGLVDNPARKCPVCGHKLTAEEEEDGRDICDAVISPCLDCKSRHACRILEAQAGKED